MPQKSSSQHLQHVEPKEAAASPLRAAGLWILYQPMLPKRMRTDRSVSESFDCWPSTALKPCEISYESAAVQLTKNDSLSTTYEFRTKYAQSGGLENNGCRETEFWAAAALSQCGGFVWARRSVFIGNRCGLANQRRMLGADATGIQHSPGRDSSLVNQDAGILGRPRG
jgi:hypothetical protein